MTGSRPRTCRTAGDAHRLAADPRGGPVAALDVAAAAAPRCSGGRRPACRARRRRAIAAITASTEDAGTPTTDECSVMRIGPISRPGRPLSLAIAPTRSAGRTPPLRPTPTWMNAVAPSPAPGRGGRSRAPGAERSPGDPGRRGPALGSLDEGRDLRLVGRRPAGLVHQLDRRRATADVDVAVVAGEGVEHLLVVVEVVGAHRLPHRRDGLLELSRPQVGDARHRLDA